MAPANETKERKATHDFLDSTGTVTEEMEKATAYAYTDIADKALFTWDSTQATPAELVMLALFGVKTLATNEASQVRQRSKADNGGKDMSTGIDQVEGIQARLDLIRSGTWVDRTREGPKWDNDRLADATADSLVADGKVPADKRDAVRAKAYAQLTDSDAAKATAFSKSLRDNPKIVAAYRALSGRATTTLDDIAAGLAA